MEKLTDEMVTTAIKQLNDQDTVPILPKHSGLTQEARSRGGKRRAENTTKTQREDWGRAGALKLAESMTPEQRIGKASRAAKARWAKVDFNKGKTTHFHSEETIALVAQALMPEKKIIEDFS